MTANTIIQIVCAVIQMFCFGMVLVVSRKSKKMREDASKMLEEARAYWYRSEMAIPAKEEE